MPFLETCIFFFFLIQLPLYKRFPNTTQHQRGPGSDLFNRRPQLQTFATWLLLPALSPAGFTFYATSSYCPPILSSFAPTCFRFFYEPGGCRSVCPDAVHQPVLGSLSSHSTKEVFPGPLAAPRRWRSTDRPQEPHAPPAERCRRLLRSPARLFPLGYFTDHPSSPPVHRTTNSYKRHRASLPPSVPSQSNKPQAADKNCYLRAPYPRSRDQTQPPTAVTPHRPPAGGPALRGTPAASAPLRRAIGAGPRRERLRGGAGPCRRGSAASHAQTRRDSRQRRAEAEGRDAATPEEREDAGGRARSGAASRHPPRSAAAPQPRPFRFQPPAAGLQAARSRLVVPPSSPPARRAAATARPLPAPAPTAGAQQGGERGGASL